MPSAEVVRWVNLLIPPCAVGALVFVGWLLRDWKDGNAGQGEPRE